LRSPVKLVGERDDRDIQRSGRKEKWVTTVTPGER
jgi:hypothetical protein